MPRITIVGNAGSGKTTLARHLAACNRVKALDLDTLAWRQDQPTERTTLADCEAQLLAWMTLETGWVIEGCYADLLRIVLPQCEELIFLNPSVDTCLANCRGRPWEPHKYPTPEAQDENLGTLLDWVADYPNRTDDCSLQAHQRLFKSFPGQKVEYTSTADVHTRMWG